MTASPERPEDQLGWLLSTREPRAHDRADRRARGRRRLAARTACSRPRSQGEYTQIELAAGDRARQDDDGRHARRARARRTGGAPPVGDRPPRARHRGDRRPAGARSPRARRIVEQVQEDVLASPARRRSARRSSTRCSGSSAGRLGDAGRLLAPGPAPRSAVAALNSVRTKIVPYKTICYGPSCRDVTCRSRTRPLPLARPRRALRRDAHDHPRRDDRERRAAVDPGRPRLLAVRPRLGRQRLPDRLRRPAAARRPARRPDRPPRVFLAGLAVFTLASLLCGLADEPGAADRRALPAGRRRRDDLGRDPRHDRDDVPRAARAGEGDRRLQLRRVRGRVDRPAGRRRADRGAQLALDLLRQRPDRRRDRRCSRCGCSTHDEGIGLGAGADVARRGARHGRADARRLHDRRGRRARLGLGADARPRRRRARAAGAASSRARRRAAQRRCCRCASSARATSPARTSSRC